MIRGTNHVMALRLVARRTPVALGQNWCDQYLAQK
jgi:hypothetical protein